MINQKSIIILGGSGVETNIMYHYLKKEFNITKVIVEQPVPKKIFLQKRVKKLGVLTVIGQLIFQSTIVVFLNLVSKKRQQEIIQKNNLNKEKIPADKIINVLSINDDDCLNTIVNYNPKVIAVCGTRIIGKKLLHSTNAIFVNIHAGITPKYRGVHGAYWALAKKDKSNCGVTVHIVDAGIDTGSVLFQKTIAPLPIDNFVTYPNLQLAEGLPLLKNAINDIFDETTKPFKPQLESKLWSHPHVFQYLFNYLFGGVK